MFSTGTEPSVCREGTRCVSPRQCAAAGGEAVSRCGDGNVCCGRSKFYEYIITGTTCVQLLVVVDY